MQVDTVMCGEDRQLGWIGSELRRDWHSLFGSLWGLIRRKCVYRKDFGKRGTYLPYRYICVLHTCRYLKVVSKDLVLAINGVSYMQG